MPASPAVVYFSVRDGLAGGMQRLGTLIGNFVLKRMLASGGMGDVFYAEHVKLGEAEARVYKILKPHLMEQRIAVERFEAEARAAAINHKNIMRARDFGTVGNSLYIEMDYFEGESLASVLVSAGGMLPPSRTVAILAGVAAGIHAAHKKTIIHRDLKPENIFITTIDGVRDVAKVLDFGVAKLRGDLALASATQSGTMVGTPAYAAPEQFEPNAQITHRVDIWALGAIAYQMATGALPHQTEPTLEGYFSVGPFQIFNRLIHHKPIDACERNPNIPPAMGRVIMRAIERAPAYRFDSAHSFVIALAESLGPDGLRIVRKYAPEFVDDNNLLETHRVAGGARSSGHRGNERYVFERKLGEGGMAEVFVGRATGADGFSRPVAIKRVLAQFSNNAQFIELFTKEARTVSVLEHTNIVQVLDYDRDTSGRPYLVMEYVQGKDLKALIKSGPLPPSIAIQIAIDILRGLEYAHGRRILHRDISPHNVLLSWDGAVKVSDFGIAKALDPDGTGHSIHAKGKPGYMSPEQIEAGQLDWRSDLYSVGIVLWEMVTGKRLFGGGVQEAFEAIMHRPPRAPSSVHPVPSDLESHILMLLARTPGLRFLDAGSAIYALLACESTPIDGHRELRHLMAERFPQEAPAVSALRSSTPSVPIRRTVTDSNLPPTVSNPRRRPAAAPAAPASIPPTTFGSAASEAVPRSAPPRRWPALAAASIVALAGVSIALVVSRRSGETADTTNRIDQLARASVAPKSGAPADGGTAAPDAPLAPVIDAVPEIAVDAAALPFAQDAGVTAVPLDASVVVVPPDAPLSGDTKPKPAIVKPFGTGTVEITMVRGQWAEIAIDGRSTGQQTPFRIALPVGRHSVLLKYDGKQKMRMIVIKKDEMVQIQEDTTKW
ncbi:MAG: protein kinase [Deltaproteobacteria bacterium]|nr:protein kinase [Deltaproteobacteria bacterium]